MNRHRRAPTGKRISVEFFVAGLCLLMLLVAPAAALQVEARLDTDAVHLGETVRLVLETDGKPANPPDLSALLQDFRIVGRQGSSSLSVVNGRRTERFQLVLTLAPVRAGLLEIPSIRFGDAATGPLQLAVGEGSTAPIAGPELFDVPRSVPPPYAVEPPPQSLPDSAPLPETESRVATEAEIEAPVLLEARIRPAEVRVAQQAVLIARVLMPVPVTRSTLHDPRVRGADVLPLGEDWDQAHRDNIDYRVYERRYALFPQKSGRLSIEPLVFEGWRQVAAEGGYQPSQVRASSEPLALDVLPAVKGSPGQRWLPARELSLDETGPETYQVQVGQPLERAISVRADGIAAADLPQLALSSPHHLEEQRSRPGLWDERTPDGVIGTRRETVRLTAREPGRFRLPAVSLSWWDTDTDNWQTASLPARDLIVLAAADDTPDRPALFEPVATKDAWTRQTSPEPEISDSVQGDHDLSAETQVDEQGEESGSGFWVWATAAFGLAWLITVGLWLGNRRRPGTASAAPQGRESAPSPAPSPLEPTDPLALSVEQVRLAYESGEAGAAREALLAWAALVLPDQPPGNLALLAKRCHEPLRGEILLLEQAFFSPRPVHWERRRVWERLPGFEPLPPEEPASFRRKKVIRRRKPSPDVTS